MTNSETPHEDEASDGMVVEQGYRLADDSLTRAAVDEIMRLGGISKMPPGRLGGRLASVEKTIVVPDEVYYEDKLRG